MARRGFILVFTALLFFGAFNKTRAQIQNSIAIVLNEYCMGNYSISDNYGVKSDWVEILNNHTFSVSLGGYFLSNDRTNLYKWEFPSTFTLGVDGIGIVYLTGKNEAKKVGNNWFYHANFNIDQCKNQWLILTTPQGVIRDSVFVQKTMAGHTRGRLDRSFMGVQAWRIYTVHSFSLANPLMNYYKDYLPMPTFTPAAGWGHNGETLDMFLNGSTVPYDSWDTLNCYEIHYTTNGCYPTYADPVYTYTSPALCQGNAPLIILENQIFRAVTYPKLAGGSCDASLDSKVHCYPDLSEYLPSFCQTNTYFSESSGSFDNLDQRFGVMSLAVDCPDTAWFRSSAAYDPTVHVEYFDGRNEVLEGYGAIHKPIQESWLTGQRGFYVTIDDRRGFGCNFEGNIFNNECLGTTPRRVFPTLHVHSGDFESFSRKNGMVTPEPANGTGIRDVFIQSLALKYNLKVNPMHMKPMILFVNGEYHGAFNLREVYDWYYTAFYKGQSKDSVYLQRFHGAVDSYVDHFEEDYRVALPFNQPMDKFKKEVHDYAVQYYGALNGPTYYNTIMSRLDKESFIDYQIINSYMMNSDLWNNNIAFGRGLSTTVPGDKWQYYLWNMPASLNFTAITTNSLIYNSVFSSPCATYSVPYNPSALGGNSHGTIMRLLMNGTTGNKSFQLDFKNRYMDLLNGALKCENILAHYDCVVDLFAKEMKYQEDPGSNPASLFSSSIGEWDTNTVRLRKIIEKRCDYMKGALGQQGCLSLGKRYGITVDVYPPEAGTVKLNTVVLPNYKWQGEYYATQISLKAAPTTTSHVFHHWEFKNHVTKNKAPLSLDSVAIDFNQDDEILAVFTDITTDIEMPTGFTPNGDGNNEEFKPLGNAIFTSEYEFRIWNRWGQEVFRSTDPAFGWNGYYEGRLAQTGVYAYVITYKNVYNEPRTLKGNVTLLR